MAEAVRDVEDLAAEAADPGPPLDDTLPLEDNQEPVPRATGIAAVHSDADPEQAARAIRLSNATGVPADVIDGAEDAFESELRSQQTFDIINNNPTLKKYILGDPMAAKVSADDWQNLNEASKAFDKLGQKSVIEQMGEGVAHTAGGVVTGFQEGFGDWDSFNQDQANFWNAVDNPVWHIFASLVGPFRGIAELGLKGLGGGFGAIMGGAAGLYGALGGVGEDQLRHDLIGMTQDLESGMLVAHVIGHGVKATPFAVRHPVEAARTLAGEAGDLTIYADPIRELFRKAAPFLREGKDIPVGAHPFVDQWKMQEAKTDSENLVAALKAAQASETYRRSPEMFEQFARQKFGDKMIGISGDAALKLYRGKTPGPGDGLLGDIVPDIADQLRRADQHGADIEISLATWLAKADPKLAAELAPDTRVRADGMTPNEADKYEPIPKGQEVVPYTPPVETAQALPPRTRAVPPTIDAEFKEVPTEAPGAAEARAEGLKGPKLPPEGAPVPEKVGEPLFTVQEYLEGLQGATPLERHNAVNQLYVMETTETPATETSRRNLSDAEVLDLASKVTGETKPGETRVEAINRVRDFMYKQPQPTRAEQGFEPETIEGEESAEPFVPEQGKPGESAEEAAAREAREKGKPKLRVVGGTDAGNIASNEQAATAESLDETIRETSGANPQAVPPPERALVSEEAKLKATPLDEPLAKAKEKGPKVPVRRKDGIDFKDTTGGDRLFAGSSNPNLVARPEAHTSPDYYGPGLYTSDAADIAYGQSKKGSRLSRSRDIYEVSPKETHEIYNMEAPLEKDIEDGIQKKHLDLAMQTLAEREPKTLRELYDGMKEVADEEGLKPDQVQREFDGIRKVMQDLGYNGMSHTGGPKDSPHHVVIHFEPKDLDLEKLNIEDLKAPKAERAKPAEVPTLPESILDKIATLPPAKLGGVALEHFTPEEQKALADAGLIQKFEGKRTKAFQGVPLKMLLRAYEQAHGLEEGEAVNLFKDASAIGMAKRAYDKFMKKVEDEQTANLERNLKRAEAYEKRMQTAEWKAREKVVEGEVSTEILSKPLFLADRFIREAGTNGKLDSKALSDEQRANLPKSYHRLDGLDPDAVANQFGYNSGDEMVNDLIALTVDRGKLAQGAYVQRLINNEVASRMAAEFGDLDQSSIEAAKEHVMSETQLDLLHAQTEYLAEVSGEGRLELTKEQLLGAVEEDVGKMPMTEINSSKALALSGRLWKDIRDALLDDKVQEAFRLSQQQYHALVYAKEMLKAEKAEARVNKYAQRYNKRVLENRSQPFTNQIQNLLAKFGANSRTAADLADSLRRDGTPTFDGFVSKQRALGRSFTVPDWLRADKMPTDNLRELTASQMRELADTLKSLDAASKAESKILIGTELARTEHVVDQMIDQLQKVFPKPKERPTTAGRAYIWPLITIESMFERIDLGDPLGLFTRAIFNPVSSSALKREVMMKEVQKELNAAIGKVPNANKKVANTIFRNQFGDLIPMTKSDMLHVIQYVGDPQAFQKMADGYKLTKDQIMTWLESVAKKEDFDRAARIGEVFKRLFELANQMHYRLNGVGIKPVRLVPFTNAFGTYDGWYNWVRYDRLRDNSRNEDPTDLFHPEYLRTETDDGYTEERTDYFGRVEFNFPVIGRRLMQIVNDITMREAGIQASKFLFHPRLMDAIRDHYGLTQRDMLIPWLRDALNATNYMNQTERLQHDIANFITSNIIAYDVGMNIHTIGKHGLSALANSILQVGPINFLREVINMLNPFSGSWREAYEKLEEIQRRHHTLADFLKSTGAQVKLRGTSAPGLRGKFLAIRDLVQYIYTFPLAMSDLLSAVPTGLAEYHKALAQGLDEKTAQDIGNRAIRQAHGSSLITNKPAVMRSSNPWANNFTMLMGFFNSNLQRYYKIAWKARVAAGAAKEGDWATFSKHMPFVAGGLAVGLLFTGLVHQLVTPYKDSEKDDLALKTVKAMAIGGTGGLPIIRDIVQSAIEGQPFSGGPIGQAISAVSAPFQDYFSHKAWTPDRAAKVWRDWIGLIGAITGLTNSTEGHMAEFMYKWSHGREWPQDLYQLTTGLVHGTMKGQPKEWEDYLRLELGDPHYRKGR